MNTNALKRLIDNNGGKEHVMVCAECGSLDVQFQAWVDANYHTYKGGDFNQGNDEEAQWCDDCQRHVRFCSLAAFEEKMDKDIAELSDEPKNATIKKEWDKLPYLRKRDVWTGLFCNENAPESKCSKKIDLQAFRDKALKKIRTIMNTYSFTEIEASDIDESCTPIIQEDPYDDNDTYTLDRIELDEHGKLSFDGSSCCNNLTLGEDNIPTDILSFIASWLDENEEDIAERFIRELTDQLDIDELGDALKEKGAKEISFSSEDAIDDGIDDDQDNYLMERSCDFVLGTLAVHGRFYFGDCSRTISCVELEINGNE